MLEFRCEAQMEEFQMNIIGNKFIFGEFSKTKLTFSKSEVTLPLNINHIVTNNFH